MPIELELDVSELYNEDTNDSNNNDEN